jgi:glycosyltransferase involved in cell wall biosynthesis
MEWKSSKYNFNDKKLNNIALIKEAVQQAKHDIFHSHFDYLHFFIADSTKKPFVATQHWFPSHLDAAAAQYNAKNSVHVIPPTNFMAAENRRLGIPVEKVINHGIDLNLFKPRSKVSNRFLFVGRITPSKGVLEAVRYAIASRVKLDVVGKINDIDKTYWQQIEPLIDGDQVRYLGPKNQEEVALLFSQAKAFIFPSVKTEAFGQVTIESQASGTPVIISDVGASKELVLHGKTGFIAETEEQFIQAIIKINKLDRSECRKFAENFNIEHMVAKYEELYRSLIAEKH